MTARKFPTYSSHDLASCFNCDGDFGPAHWGESGSAPGDGEFVQACCKCGMSTWYDLKDRVLA